MDPTRTKPVLASGRLAEDWSDYVLAARLMLLARRRRQLRARGGADDLRRVGGRGHRRPPAHAGRPRLPLHHPVPARASSRLARGAVARLPPGRPGRGGQRGRHRAAASTSGRATWPSRRARPSTAWRRGPPPRASARAIPTSPLAGAATLRGGRGGARSHAGAAALGGVRGRRRVPLARQGPVAGRRPRGSPRGRRDRCSSSPTRRWRSRGREHLG